ncbi:MAG: DNA-binding protein [Rhodopseudomonas palustris]|nr:MAG: DNA-binding protein [Rhodopseudomonas palustris]
MTATANNSRSPAANAAPSTVNPDELIEATEAATLLRQKPQTLAAWRCDGKGPEYVKIGRRVLYRRDAISSWLASQIVQPGAKAA